MSSCPAALNHVTPIHFYLYDEMPMEFSTYIVQLNDAILLENGPNLAYLLRPTSPHGKDLVKEFRNPTVGDGIRFWNYFIYLQRDCCD